MRSFGIARLVAIGSVGTGVTSLLLYPGGTYLDPSARGYSFFHNLLSDAGMTVAFNGQPNAAGSAFAMATTVLAAVALGCCAGGLVGVYASSPSQRRPSIVAAALLLLSTAGFIGAVVSPPNRSPVLHMYFATFALGVGAAAALAFAGATLRDTRFPRAVPIAWLAVAVLIPMLVTERWWGPAVTTQQALMFHATSQKFVIFSAVAILAFQSRVASRVAGAGRHNEGV